MIKSFFTHSLYSYDKSKVSLLKSILPIIIIVHHISTRNYQGLSFFISASAPVMYLFFAMSGYGLVISYKKNKEYINGFLKKSLPKLFVPYVITLALFIIYRFINGVDQIELLRTKGLFSFVPTSWFIYVLSLFYIFFYVVFKYIKTGILKKIFFVSLLVFLFYLIAPYVGIASWRYLRCPGFIVGMYFAFFDNQIRAKFVRWHMFIAICVLLYMTVLPAFHRLEAFYYPSIVFFMMYVLRVERFSESKIVKLLSTISLEMFIVQYIPIYFVTDYIVFGKSYNSTLFVVVLVVVLDVILAFLMHKLVVFFRMKLESRMFRTIL